MRSILVLILWASSRLFADVVTLNDGRQVTGWVESGNTQELHIKTGDQSQTLDIHEVQAIQFGVTSAAAPSVPAKATPPETRTLILKDGTRVTGKWWAIDAGQIHFLVNNQLQHYPRSDVSAVTSGDAIQHPTTAPSSPTAASPAQAPAAAKPQPSESQRSSSSQPAAPPPTQPAATARPQPPASRSSASTSPEAPRGVSQPEEIGAVYFWNGRDLTPLERSQAVERKSGSTQYWELPGAQSRVRVEEASAFAFIVRLAKGVNPAIYSLFPLTTSDGSRQTRIQPGKGGLMTWPFDIQINNESGYMTYAFIVKDLPLGEYSFSPSNSNASYCFGVDSSPGQ